MYFQIIFSLNILFTHLYSSMVQTVEKIQVDRKVYIVGSLKLIVSSAMCKVIINSAEDVMHTILVNVCM